MDGEMAEHPPARAHRSSARLSRVRLGLVVAVTLLAAGVAGLGYLVSFEAISSFVVRIGALPTSLRWCGPLLVDTFSTLATLFLVWLALSGVRLRHCWDAYYAWALIAVATIASAYLNAAHVQPVGPTGAVRQDARFAAGAVPFAVLASVHLLVSLLLRLLALPAAEVEVTSAIEPDPTGKPAREVDQPAPAAAPLQDSQSRQDDQLVRRVVVRSLLAGETHDKPVSWQDVHAATGLSRSRSYALLRQEREALARTNGQPTT
jgi:hypothetical protein